MVPIGEMASRLTGILTAYPRHTISVRYGREILCFNSLNAITNFSRNLVTEQTLVLIYVKMQMVPNSRGSRLTFSVLDCEREMRLQLYNFDP